MKQGLAAQATREMERLSAKATRLERQKSSVPATKVRHEKERLSAEATRKATALATEASP